jgi:choline-glycine betaine transporter
MVYALVVVLLLFLAAMSGGIVIVIWGVGAPVSYRRQPPRS